MKSALTYIGDLPYIKFHRISIQKEFLHHINPEPIMLSMTGHTAASFALFDLQHAYVMDSLYWKEYSIVTYETKHLIKLLSTHFWTL